MKRLCLGLMTCAIAAAMIVGATTSSADDAAATAPAKSADAKAKGEKFYGSITAVNTNAMTFAIGDQTFTVAKDTPMTKNDKPATLADAVVGEPARGSYVKADDGKLNVTKVRFGKKTGGKAGGKKKKSDGTDSTTPAPTQN